MTRPTMEHLDGFWLPDNWGPDRQAIFRERTERDRRAAKLDQLGHYWMGVGSRVVGDGFWLKREHKQWPSKTGSIDAWWDAIWFRTGRGDWQYAGLLLAGGLRRWPDALDVAIPIPSVGQWKRLLKALRKHGHTEDANVLRAESERRGAKAA